jgi:hypothetical protein
MELAEKSDGDRHRQHSEAEKEAINRAQKEAQRIETVKEARKMFFETLPILMYLDEMRRDIKLSEAGKETSAAHFRDLFCPKTDRHQLLRRDFAKFDEHRYQRFRNFLLGIPEEESEGAAVEATYFQNVYKQLKEVAAFLADKSPMEALQAATCLDATDVIVPEAHLSEQMILEERVRQLADLKTAAEARARWVCVQRVAQTVQPDLFPFNKPQTPNPRASFRTRASVSRDLNDVADSIDYSDEDSPSSHAKRLSPRRQRSSVMNKRGSTCSSTSRTPRRPGTTSSRGSASSSKRSSIRPTSQDENGSGRSQDGKRSSIRPTSQDGNGSGRSQDQADTRRNSKERSEKRSLKKDRPNSQETRASVHIAQDENTRSKRALAKEERRPDSQGSKAERRPESQGSKELKQSRQSKVTINVVNTVTAEFQV